MKQLIHKLRINRVSITVLTPPIGIILVLCLQSCTPWVKPYERAKLASEVMQYDRDPISDSYMHHVRQAREGARGAEGAGGGGCGCN